MPIDINGKKLYSTMEVAKRLKVSDGMVRTWLRTGRIVGIKFGNNTYYTDEQIANVDREKRKRGPKTDNDEDEESSVALTA